MSEVAKRYATDEVFREVADLLYGGGADDLIHKANPDQSDISAAKEKRNRTQARVALGSNAIGIAAGTAALRDSYVNVKRAKKEGGKVKIPKTKWAIPAIAGAGAGLALQSANLGGDIVANRVLSRSAKKDEKKVSKGIDEIEEQAKKVPTRSKVTQASITTAARAAGKGAEYSKGKFKRLPDKVETKNVSKARRPPKLGSLRRIKQDVAQTASNAKHVSNNLNTLAREATKTSKTTRRTVRAVGAAGVGGAAAGGLGAGDQLRSKYKKQGYAKKTKTKIGKNLDLRWEGEISKVDTDKQQVFGWASIVEMNGEPVVDLQGDYIAIDEVEKSAYEYVHKSRKGGDMHLRDEVMGTPIAKSHMIESFVVTPEKKQALGLPAETPTGWWVGYQVNDPDLWAKVKSGERTGFSIHGRGVRD